MRNRVLENEQDKYKENAWDYASISEEKRKTYLKKIEDDEKSIRTDPHNISYEAWEEFYRKHRNLFFKERRWIKKEFPELEGKNKRVLEVGCGTGSTLSQIPEHAIYGVDYSESAINIIKSREDLKHGAFYVHDISSEDPLPCREMDYLLFIFTLSAIHPSSHVNVLAKARNALKKDGVILFRDYAEMDLTQIRFKPSQVLEKNLYLRGEGTYAYFFTKEKIELAAKKAGLKVIDVLEDRRLLINRKKQIEMPRHWLQVKMKREE